MKDQDVKGNFLNKGYYVPNYSFSASEARRFESFAVSSSAKTKFSWETVKIER
jgi:hypothetical protein